MALRLLNAYVHAKKYLVNPKRLADDVIRFGPLSTLQWLMANLGVKTYTRTSYPIVDLKVTTLFDGTWKRIERGEIELNCIKRLSEVVKQGDTVFDIGSWHGTYTLLISHLVGKSGRVIAFEPVPEVRGVLGDNVRKNSMTNVKVEPFCLSNSVGEVTIHIDSAGGTTSSIVSNQLISKGQDISIPCTTVDKYCKDCDIWPTGMKLDVEGAEGLVIEGCREVIQRCHPWVLLEFHGQLFSEDQRKANWEKLTQSAKEIIFVDGEGTSLGYGARLREMPDCTYFHAFLQY